MQNFYNNVKLKISSNNGVLDFVLHQQDNILFGSYNGENVRFGTIIGIVDTDSKATFNFQEISNNNETITGNGNLILDANDQFIMQLSYQKDEKLLAVNVS